MLPVPPPQRLEAKRKASSSAYYEMKKTKAMDVAAKNSSEYVVGLNEKLSAYGY